MTSDETEPIDILEGNLISDILWELRNPGPEISNPRVKDLAKELEGGKPVKWSRDLISQFLAGVPDVKSKLNLSGEQIERMEEITISIRHEMDGVDAYQGVHVRLQPYEIPIDKMMEFGISYASNFSGPSYKRRSKFVLLIEKLLAEAVEKRGVTIVAGAGIDPYIPFAETLTRFAGIENRTKKFLVVIVCAISLLLPPAPTARSLCNLARSHRNIDVVTSNWSCSLERNSPPTMQFYNVRKIDPEKIAQNAISLTFGSLKDPNELSQHLRNIGPKNIVFVVGCTLSAKDFGKTGLGEHMSGADWILVFTLNADGFQDKLRDLMRKEKEEISFIMVIDDLHSVFNYIKSVVAGRPPTVVL
jgi:hypothetical protein